MEMESDSKLNSANDVDSQLSVTSVFVSSPGCEKTFSISLEGAVGKEQMEEQIAQLRAENCQLQTRLFHIEQFVLPGKHRETEQLLQQIGMEKMVTAQTEQQRLCAVEQLHESMTTLKSVLKEKKQLETELASSQANYEELELQHKRLTDELQVLKNELNTKTIQCENERQTWVEKETGFTENELEKVKMENSNLRDLLEKSEQTVQSLLLEKAHIERADLLGVNLSHQKEIHNLIAKVKRLKVDKEKYLSTSHSVIELLVATTQDLKLDTDNAAVSFPGGSSASKTQQQPATPEMETKTLERKLLGLDATPSSSAGLNIGPEFHSVDKSSNGEPRCVCGKRFHNKQTLTNHILLYGESKRPFACAKCPKRYPARHTLRMHEKSVHNISHSKRGARKKREGNRFDVSFDHSTLNLSSNSSNMEALNENQMECSESEEELGEEN